MVEHLTDAPVSSTGVHMTRPVHGGMVGIACVPGAAGDRAVSGGGMTGKRCALGLGWLQGTTRTADRATLRGYLASIFGEPFTRKGGVQWYRQSEGFGESGVLIAWEPVSDWSWSSELFVQVPQSALDGLGWDGGLELMAQLVRGFRVRPSRLDVYVDDHARTADPLDVLEALRAGNARTHVKKWRQITDSDDGMTVYVGSRTAECMVRVYRKWAESGDPDAGVRWEMETKGDRAALVADLMIDAHDTAGERFVSLLRAFVDFVDRDEQTRGDRAPLLGWWAALVANVARATVRLGVVPDTFARRVRWLRKSVAPTLAVLVATMGRDGLDRLLEEGRRRADLRPVLRYRQEPTALRFRASGAFA